MGRTDVSGGKKNMLTAQNLLTFSLGPKPTFIPCFT